MRSPKETDGGNPEDGSDDGKPVGNDRGPSVGGAKGARAGRLGSARLGSALTSAPLRGGFSGWLRSDPPLTPQAPRPPVTRIAMGGEVSTCLRLTISTASMAGRPSRNRERV